jgi:hypothetical protein
MYFLNMSQEQTSLRPAKDNNIKGINSTVSQILNMHYEMVGKRFPARIGGQGDEKFIIVFCNQQI